MFFEIGERRTWCLHNERFERKRLQRHSHIARQRKELGQAEPAEKQQPKLALLRC